MHLFEGRPVRKFALLGMTVVLFGVPATAFSLSPIQQSPATATGVSVDEVIQLHKAGIGENILITRIKQGNKPLQLSTEELLKLSQAKVPERVIHTLMDPANASTAPAVVPSATNSAPPVASAPPDSTANLDVGVYFRKKEEWLEVMPEVINWKTGGFLKGIASGGLVKGDVNGNIKGAQSRNSVITPLEFLIKAPEGVAITEYQLIRLRKNKNDREFRTVTGGVLHSSGGATRDVVEFEGKRIANRTFSVVLPDKIGAGEYGFLPPGAFTSANSSSIGKMYTFRVVE